MNFTPNLYEKCSFGVKLILYIVQTKSSSKTQTRVQNDKHIYHSFFDFLQNKYEYMVSVVNMKNFS